MRGSNQERSESRGGQDRDDQSYGSRRSEGCRNGRSERYDETNTGNWGSSDSDGQYDDEKFDGSRDAGAWRGQNDEVPSYRDGNHGMRGGQTSHGSRRWGSDGMRGEHTGKGPKGYQRSDERLQEDVSEALSQHGGADASDVEVDVKDGEVTLSGTVADREMKRLAEDCVENCSGVSHVQNNLRVASAAKKQESGAKHGSRSH